MPVELLQDFGLKYIKCLIQCLTRHGRSKNAVCTATSDLLQTSPSERGDVQRSLR